MISETQQEQASLYVLGLLDATEAAAFEQEMAADPALAALVRELGETTAGLALAAGESAVPSSALKTRVLRAVAPSPAPVLPTARSPFLGRSLFPWALAALLLGCTVFLAVDRANLRKEVSHFQASASQATPPADALTQIAFCELEPTPQGSAAPRAAVLWDPAQHRGVLRVSHLDPAAPGRDYQLWAVEKAQKEPVNAGVVHVDPAGQTTIPFQPDPILGDSKVVALAISLERAGGSPTNQGPILFLGKL